MLQPGVPLTLAKYNNVGGRRGGGGGQKELRPNILILSSTLARLRYTPLNF